MTRQQANYGYVVDNRGLFGLTHSTKDTLQLLAYMRGVKKIPRDIWKFISEQQYREAEAVQGAGSGQDLAYVLELSSLKVLKYRDLTLQAVRFNEAFHAARNLRKIFFDYPSENERSTRIDLLEAQPEFAQLPAVFRSVLSETVQLTQSYDEIRDDLREIKALLGDRLVVVPHCNAVDKTGSLLEDRAKGVKWVLEASRELNILSVDPGALLEKFGQARGMEKEGLDTAHFTPEFANIVGDAICLQLFGGDKAARNTSIAAITDWRAGAEQAKLFARSKQWDQALLFANRTLELNPGFASAKLVRAQAVTAMGQTDDMLDAWKQALDLHQNHTGGAYRMGAQCAMTLGELDLAVKWAQLSYDLTPTGKTALTLAEAYARKGIWLKAQEFFGRYAQDDQDVAIRYAAHPRRNPGDAAMVIHALQAAGNTDGRLNIVREKIWKQAIRRATSVMKSTTVLPDPDDYNAIEVFAPDESVATRYTGRTATYLLNKFAEDAQWSAEPTTPGLIGRFMKLRTIKEATLTKAARMLQDSGAVAIASDLWAQVARRATDIDRALKATEKVVKLGDVVLGVECYQLLRKQDGADVTVLDEKIDRGIKVLIRTFKAQLAESDLPGADATLENLARLVPDHRHLKYFRRLLTDAFKGELTGGAAAPSERPALTQKLAMRILEVNPNDSDANIELAYSYLRNGQIAEGQRIIRQLGGPAR